MFVGAGIVLACFAASGAFHVTWWAVIIWILGSAQLLKWML